MRGALLALAVICFLPAAATAQTAYDAASSVQATLQAAKAAIDRNDYAQALRLLRPIADQGDARAEAILGVLYEHGLGVTEDFDQAVKWYNKAAAQGSASAELALGRLYVRRDDPKYYHLASELLHKAADQGDAEAEFWIGLMYYEGKGVPQNYREASVWFGRAADKGNALGETMLGFQYFNGEGVQKNYARALELIRKGADQRYDVAQYGLGLMYAGGLGVPQDLDEALKWFRMAAAQGHEKAKQYVAELERHKREAARAGVPPSLQFKCVLEAFDPKVAGAGGNKDLIEGMKRSSNDPRYQACIERFNKKYGTQYR